MLVVVILLINAIIIVSEAAYKITVAKNGFLGIPCSKMRWPLSMISENSKFLFVFVYFSMLVSPLPMALAAIPPGAQRFGLFLSLGLQDSGIREHKK